MTTPELITQLRSAGCIVETRLPGTYGVYDQHQRHLFHVRQFTECQDIIDLRPETHYGSGARLRSTIRVQDIASVEINDHDGQLRDVRLLYNGASIPAVDFRIEMPMAVQP